MKQDSPISSYYYLILSVPDIQTVDATVVACAQLCPRYPNSWRHSFRVCPALPQISKQLTRQFLRVPSSAPDIQTVDATVFACAQLCPRYPNSWALTLSQISQLLWENDNKLDLLSLHQDKATGQAIIKYNKPIEKQPNVTWEDCCSISLTYLPLSLSLFKHTNKQTNYGR